MKCRNVFGGVFVLSLAMVALASCGPDKVTVKFFKGTNLLSEKAYNIGEVIEAPANPANYTENHMIYTFDAWYQNDDTKIGKYEAGLKASKEVSYFAGWDVTEEQFYTVKFEDCGNLVESKKYYTDQTIVIPADRQEYYSDHKRYTFDGWYDGDTKLEEGTKPTKNVTYVSKYTSTDKIYKVTFIDEFHENSTFVFEGAFGEKIEVPADPQQIKDEDSHHYKEFNCWRDVATDYPLSSEATVTGNQTFRASYVMGDPIIYKATFYSGPKLVDTINYSIDNTSIEAPEITGTREGYTAYWYSPYYDYGFVASKETIVLTTFMDELRFDKTNPPIPNPHTVRFLDEDGDQIKVVTKDYNEIITGGEGGDCPIPGTDERLPEKYPGEDHYMYEFNGWYSEKDGSKLEPGTTHVPDYDVNYRAKYVRGEQIDYVVKFIDEKAHTEDIKYVSVKKEGTHQGPTFVTPATRTPEAGYEVKWVSGSNVISGNTEITFGTKDLPLQNTTFIAKDIPVND